MDGSGGTVAERQILDPPGDLPALANQDENQTGDHQGRRDTETETQGQTRG
jgi:hypothetical protein